MVSLPTERPARPYKAAVYRQQGQGKAPGATKMWRDRAKEYVEAHGDRESFLAVVAALLRRRDLQEAGKNDG